MQAFKLPDLGEGLQEAEVVEWLVTPGESVKVDQLLVLVETAKAIVELPSPVSGSISKLCAHVGDIIQVGATLVEFDGDKVSNNESVSVVGELQTSNDTCVEENFIIGSVDVHPKPVSTENNLLNHSKNKLLAPPGIIAFARKLGLEHKLNAANYGDVGYSDLLKLYESQTNKNLNIVDANESENKIIKLSGAKKVMAQTMSKSWQQVPAVTLFDDADVSSWEPGEDITLRLLTALITSCKAVPLLNAWFDEENMRIQMFKDINIGVAVNTNDGLYVPVISKAQDLNGNEIKTVLSSLIEQVTNKKIIPQKLLGATISLSNFGTLSGRYATPIIVPPQVAIVGIGKLREEALVRDGDVVVGRVLPISLTFDHRAASGADAAEFLSKFIDALQ